MESKTYYIYHIPNYVHPDGRIGKIGCAKNPASRVACQGYISYTILEEHSCIHEASRRERELQKQWGYRVDSKPYWQVVQMASTGGKASSLVGAQSKAGKIGGKIAGRIAVESGQLASIRSAGSRAASKIVNAMRVQCPYCDKISTPGAIGTHKKTCKQKPL